MLQLGEFDRRLLLHALVFERRPRANALMHAMARAQVDMVVAMGIAAGADNGSAARASPVMRLGLFDLTQDYLAVYRGLLEDRLGRRLVETAPSVPKPSSRSRGELPQAG